MSTVWIMLLRRTARTTGAGDWGSHGGRQSDQGRQG